MAQVPDNIIDIIKRFITEAESDKIRISEAILFGSYASGKYNEFSDIDLALVSDNFEGLRFKDNMRLMKSVLSVSSDIETHPFTPSDFTPENPFVKEILRTGIRII